MYCLTLRERFIQRSCFVTSLRSGAWFKGHSAGPSKSSLPLLLFPHIFFLSRHFAHFEKSLSFIVKYVCFIDALFNGETDVVCRCCLCDAVVASSSHLNHQRKMRVRE